MKKKKKNNSNAMFDRELFSCNSIEFGWILINIFNKSIFEKYKKNRIFNPFHVSISTQNWNWKIKKWHSIVFLSPPVNWVEILALSCELIWWKSGTLFCLCNVKRNQKKNFDKMAVFEENLTFSSIFPVDKHIQNLWNGYIWKNVTCLSRFSMRFLFSSIVNANSSFCSLLLGMKPCAYCIENCKIYSFVSENWYKLHIFIQWPFNWLGKVSTVLSQCIASQRNKQVSNVNEMSNDVREASTCMMRVRVFNTLCIIWILIRIVAPFSIEIDWRNRASENIMSEFYFFSCLCVFFS